MEKQVHVSFYASLFRTECKVLTLEEIIILIRRRRWKNEILAYRTALAEGRAENIKTGEAARRQLLSLASGQRELVLPDYTNTMKIEGVKNEE